MEAAAPTSGRLKSAGASAGPMAAKRTSGKDGNGPAQGFSDEERAAMRERTRELRSQSRANKADGEAEVLAKIAEMTGTDRILAEKLHRLVRRTAPTLVPRTWYGMPAYAKGDSVLCWFQPAAKFKARYATFSFSDGADLDDGPMWPVSYAILELTPDLEARLTALVAQAAGKG